MFKVYFEGAWDEIISARGFKLFKKNGILLFGDSFYKERSFSLEKTPYPDLIIATNPNLNALNFGVLNNIPVIYYTIFPDQIIGWNFERNQYKFKISKKFKDNLQLSKKVLVNSDYSLELIKRAWPEFVDLNPSLCYLGIDATSIGKVMPKQNRESINVLWNHMWRKDKGFKEALEIILELAKDYSNVNFIIGRKDDWDPRGDKGEKKSYLLFLKKIKESGLNNVHFKKTSEVYEYWKLLKTINIAFSTSYHETFGLSILEQEAAKIATVLPNIEAYPEVHKGSMLVDYKEIKNSIQKLINNTELRSKVREDCFKNAQSYNIDNFVITLSRIITNQLT